MGALQGGFDDGLDDVVVIESPLDTRRCCAKMRSSVGTASKLMWGGLRVGWIRGAQPTIAGLTEARRAVDLAVPVLEQIVTARLLADANLSRVARRPD